MCPDNIEAEIITNTILGGFPILMIVQYTPPPKKKKLISIVKAPIEGSTKPPQALPPGLALLCLGTGAWHPARFDASVCFKELRIRVCRV